jgi:hypothetical protein
MKKQVVVILVVILVLLFAFQGRVNAQEYDDYNDRGKRVAAFVGLGYAFSDYEGPVLNLGMEIQFSNNFYGIFDVEFYTDPSPDFEEIWDVNLTITGINILGAYKFFPNDSKFNIGFRGGILVTARKAKSELLGGEITNSTSDFGATGGLSIDYALNERFGIILGTNIYFSFEDETTQWYKIYGGMSYRIK